MNNHTFNPLILRSSGAMSSIANSSHAPIHFDDEISMRAREVKLWSYILVFLSAMTIFDVFSALLSVGISRLMTTTVHGIVVTMNLLSSLAGVWVGQLGMQAAVSLDMAQIGKYVAYLQWLALFTLVMRILWVVDITQEVQKVVDDSHNAPTTTGTGGTGGSGSAQSQEPLDQDTVDSYTFQATVIAFTCAYAWAMCVFQAHRLRTSVSHYAATETPSTIRPPAQQTLPEAV